MYPNMLTNSQFRLSKLKILIANFVLDFSEKSRFFAFFFKYFGCPREYEIVKSVIIFGIQNVGVLWPSNNPGAEINGAEL